LIRCSTAQLLSYVSIRLSITVTKYVTVVVIYGPSRVVSPAELCFHDRSNAAGMRQSWCESGQETVLLKRQLQTRRDHRTVKTQQLGPRSSPDRRATSQTEIRSTLHRVNCMNGK